MGRRSLLHDGPFRRLWAATAASGMATWGLPFVLGLAVLDRSLTATELGSLLAARTVGYLAAVPAGGLLADRYPRRRVIAASGSAAGLAIAVVAAALGRSTPWMAAGMLVAGAGHGASRPAFQAFVADVVDPSRRQEANAAVTLAVQGTSLVPPAVAALASVFVGTRVLLLGVAAFWLAAAVLPPRVRTSTGAGRGRASVVAELVAGGREARRHPWFVAGLGAVTTVVATGFAATAVALPLVSRDRYGSGAVLAAATTAYTGGALTGALLMARWRPRAPGWVALAGLACYGVAPLSLLVPVGPAVVIAAYVVAGVGIEVFNVPWFTATQHEVHPDLLARVTALDFLLTYGLSPVGLALIAPAIDAFGASTVLATCSAVCFLAPAAVAFVPSSRTFSKQDGTRGTPRSTESTSTVAPTAHR